MNKKEVSMNYGELFLIKDINSVAIGVFICQRPNGNIIYDRYYLSETYKISTDFKSFYEYKVSESSNIFELKKDGRKKYEFIKTEEVKNFFDDKIKELKNTFSSVEIDKKLIKEIKNNIKIINDEIDSTRLKPIDSSLSKEEIKKAWNNKNKAIQQMEKGVRRLEKKIETINLKNETENKKLKGDYEKALYKFKESKRCITDFIKNYKNENSLK